MYYNNLTRNIHVVCLVTLLIHIPLCFNENVDLHSKTTNGQVWPKPTHQQSYAGYLKFKPKYFYFNVRSNIFKIIYVYLFKIFNQF